MSLNPDLYPSSDDLQYEEELLRNTFSLRLWWRYLVARSSSPFEKRFIIYERALKALPGSYKLWHAYLRERLEVVRNLPINHPQFKTLNNTFERALVTMHKMPRIWEMYLGSLVEQRLVTRTRRTFNRALCALPVTQHERIWGIYLGFVSQKGVPIETSLRVYRRYLMYDPGHIEDFIEFLVDSELWQEAAERLARVLNDDGFYSIKGKTKHRLWLELCDLLTTHATEVKGLNVDAIIRGGIRKFTDEVGRLWTSLAEYYIRRKLTEKARDVFEEGTMSVVTVRDFSVIFDAYSQFEESMLAVRMEKVDLSDVEEGDGGEELLEDEEEVDIRNNIDMSLADFEKKVLHGFWLYDENDIDLRLVRLEHLMDRRPELVNSVLLRQNPHNVEQWHRRVNLFEGNPTRQILTYTEAVRTVDPMKAVGKPHTLWIAFAKLYESHSDLDNARVIFDRAVQQNFKTVDHLASVWCEWAEMELKHKYFDKATALMQRATAVPSAGVKRIVAMDSKDPNEPVQMKLHRSLRLWTFYVDLEESISTLESTRGVYDRILELKIATPQIIINYAMFLEEHKYFEDAFQIYERGVKIFKYPHVKDIWVTYLSKFVKRYGKSKLERARELFERAVESASPESVKPLFLQYAKLEEDYGLSKRAMKVYLDATKAVPAYEKLSMYEIYIARAAEIYGVSETRKIYEQAIQTGLPDKDVKTMCLKYAELEKMLGEIDRARTIFAHASQFADPRTDLDFWNRWHEFEVHHGNEETFREMLRIKRSVSASYNQTHFILMECVTRKDEAASLEKPVEAPKQAPISNDITRILGFVSAGVESHDVGRQRVANPEDIELSDDCDSEVEDKVEVAGKEVPEAVFGGLLKKRKESSGRGNENGDGAMDKGKDAPLGALERIKRLKRP